MPIKIIISLLSIIIAVYVAFALLLYLFQDQMLYHPTPEVFRPNTPVMYIHHDDVKIKLWQLHPGQKKAIVFFGGNADAVEHYIAVFGDDYADYTVYLVNYRAYGGSSGKPNEAALYRDALAIYDTVKPSHDSIIVMGRSLGSGVASYLASQKDVEKLVLITPFDSILHVAQKLFPMYPMSMLLQDQYDSASRAKDVDCAVLILAAGEDRTIPPMHTQALVSKFKRQQLTVRWWDHATHNNIFNQHGFQEIMLNFVIAPISDPR